MNMLLHGIRFDHFKIENGDTRYVDTFEEEEPVNIHAVMAEIKQLEAKRTELAR